MAFTNELGLVAGTAGVDRAELLEMFVADDKLNISSAYLKPGFAYGGPCLPKDVNILTHWCEANGLQMPLIAGISRSNDLVVDRVVADILALGSTRIGFLGLAFKAGVCDLRGSPFAIIANKLKAAGRTVRAFDPTVSRGRKLGMRADYTDGVIEGLGDILEDDMHSLTRWAEIIVLTSAAYSSLPLDSDAVIVDLSASRRPGPLPDGKH